MAIEWMNVKTAAHQLRLSERTVMRHIAAGKLESRLTADGRREVAVDLDDARQVSFMTDDAPAADTRHDVTGQAVADVSTALMTLADVAADKSHLAVAAYNRLAQAADEQARNYRTSARMAWSLTGVLTVVIVAGVAWSTHRVTRTSAENDALRASAGAAAAVAQERDQLRAQLTQLQLDNARAEERLALAHDETPVAAAAVVAPVPAPTTRPTFFGRLVSSLSLD